MSIKIEFDFVSLFKKLCALLSRFNIGHLLLLSFALHMFVIPFPQDGFIFDEAHYVPAALKTLQLQPANAEHTPLAKIVIAISIAIFGNYWFAWRFPIVIMAIASLYVFYLIAKRFMPDKYALFATAFLSFDIIYFVHGSIFVLDMPAILFGLIGMERYVAKKYKWSALAFGISFLMKELGLFFLGTVLMYHLLAKTRISALKSQVNWKKLTIFTLVLLLIAGSGLWIYELLYKPSTGTTIFQTVHNTVFVDQNGTPITTSTAINNVTSESLITNPITHMEFAWKYFVGLAPNIVTEEVNYRPPWGWILPIGDIFNSPHYFGVVITTGGTSKSIIDYVSQITPTIAYMFIPILLVSVCNLLRKKETKLSIFYLSWITSSYLPWLLLGIFIQRMTFNYYFIYTIPVLALGIPYFWSNMSLSERGKKYAILLHLVLTVAFFLRFFPVILLRG